MDLEPDTYHFGAPIPDDPHGISVGMPKWQNVVDYEEGKPAALAEMEVAYPRFFLHPFYQKLRASYASAAQLGETVWVFPSLKVAEACVQFTGQGRTQATNQGVALAILPLDAESRAKAFWQHRGDIVSSRQAENILESRQAQDIGAVEDLRRWVAELYTAHSDDVYLFPTGMAAVFAAYQTVVCKPGAKTIQLGFPYTDTLKIQEKFGSTSIYVPYNQPEDLELLEQHLKQGHIAAIFCEIPGNPLLRTVDLQKLHILLTHYDVPLILDDTLAPPTNVHIQRFADITVTSLTKFVSGHGNVMGGSLHITPAAKRYANFKHRLNNHEELLYPDDAQILLGNAQGFCARMPVINRNTERLVAFLKNHPAVQDVFYPKGDPAYEALRRPDGGYGGLFSFTLKFAGQTSHFYDALAIAKGPSLGMEETLVCPYTLLAHYNELPWAEANGVSRHLIRVSPGIENIDDLIERFARALTYAAIKAPSL